MSDNPVDKPKMRTSIDVATDVGAASIYGSSLGLEAIEFSGDMALTGMTIDKALRMFLGDVAQEGGPEQAAVYAARLIETLRDFLPVNAANPPRRKT